MGGSSVDWDFHRANYAKNFAERMTVAEYARQQGLNANTARRAMKGAGAAPGKDSDQKPDAPKSKKNTKKGQGVAPVGDAAARALSRAKKVVTAKAREYAAEVRQREIEAAERDRLEGDHLGGDHQKGDHLRGDHPDSDHPKRSPGLSDKSTTQAKSKAYERRSQGGDHTSDHLPTPGREIAEREVTRPNKDVSTAFGGYASLVNLPTDIFEAASMLARDDGDLMLSSGRYLLMYRTQQDLIAKLKADYDAGKPWLDDAGNPIAYTQAEYQLIFGCSQRMTELESSLGRRKLGAQKLELDRHAVWAADRERHPIPLATRQSMIREILDLKDKHGMTAVEVARIFEAEGLELPKSIHAEMLREISWMEAPTDTTGGITDDELEAMSRQYLADQAEVVGEWLPARRSQFEAMMAEEVATQQGDTLDEEEFNDEVEPEILADDPDSDVQESW